MEKKKIKLWKIILIVILVLIVLFAIITMRKVIIIKSLQDKIANYQEKTNFYYKVQNSNPMSGLVSYEVYRKEDNEKKIMTQTETNNTITQYILKDKTRTYWNVKSENKKIMSESSDEPLMLEGVISHVDFENVFQIALASMFSEITTENIDGKDCYIITNLYDNGYLALANVEKTKTFFDKNTGIAIKKVEILDTGEESVITYEYKFDCVTDEDLKEPDISEYEVRVD